MASIADTDSLSGVEPLDSTATSPLLKAAAISAHPDTISPASQLSSLRASLIQSSTLLKGSDDQPGSHLEDSPEFRLSNVSTLTQSSLEKHNISHPNSGASVDAVWQDHRYPGPQVDTKKEAWIKGMSSLPSTPYSSRQHDQQPQRLLATADNKSHSQIQRDLRVTQDTSRHSRPTLPANRQLFDSQTAKETLASNQRHTHSGKEPPPPKTSPEGRRDFVHHLERSIDKPELLSRGRGNSQNTSLLQSYHTADVRQATTLNWSQTSHREVDRSNPNSHEKTHQTHHHDYPQKQRVPSTEKNLPEIQEMEKVRRSLYHMVHNSMGRQQLERDSLESKESMGETLAANRSGAERDFPRESFDSARTESLLGPQAYPDVSPLAMDSGLGLSSLWNLSNVPTLRASSRDGTLIAENQMLKDSLEKERYRRKHCEKQIGDVQAKLLETQQQLAVAVSTDRKKDAMIEQLDKTLARIVDGWRKQEQDKDEALEIMANEKQDMAEEMDKLRKALGDHQVELDQAEEKLSSELQQALQLQRDTVTQFVSLQEDHSKMKDQLVSERKLTTQSQHQRDSAIEERHRLDKQVKQVQHMLAEERQQSQSMRKDLQERVEQLEKEHQQLLENQKVKLAEESKTSEILSARQQEVDKLKVELDNAAKDKENMGLELNLQQAKAEATQQKLEAEWQAKLERLVDDRMRELQLQSSKAEAELREAHRKQLSELHDRHQSQVLSQRSSHAQDLAQRDKKIQELTQGYKTRLEQHHQDMAQMTQRLKKAQQQRSVLVQRLQGVQVYCTDVLSQVTSASPLAKELSSEMEAVIGARRTPAVLFTTGQSERTQGTRPQDSPITISVSPPKRGVGVGAGNLDDNNQEHEGGDGQEDDTFHLPNLSMATSTASQSPPTNNLFSFIPDASLKPNPGGSAFFKQDAVNMSEFFNIPAVQDTTDDGFASLSYGRVPDARLQMQGDSFGSFKMSDRKEGDAESAFQGRPLQHQGFHSISAPRPDATHMSQSWKEPNVKDPLAHLHEIRPDFQASTLQPNQKPTQSSHLPVDSRTNSEPVKEPSQRKEPLEEYIPSQKLISDGLRMLEMSPPSGHSSPLRDPPSGLAGLTLGDILRATGGWDGLREGTRRGGQEEFGEFREILPSFDDTKTTNSVAAYPSEDETVSELESGPINPDSSNVLLERLAEHGQRQMALQHYIKMLLQQQPGATTEEQTASRTTVTKETVNSTSQKQGMTTWQELAPQGHKRAPTSTRNPSTNPRMNQAVHPQGNTQQSQRSKSSGVGGSTGPRQTTDKQGSSSKTKGQTVAQPQHSRTARPTQRAVPATKPNRQTGAPSATGHKKVVRKGAVRS